MKRKHTHDGFKNHGTRKERGSCRKEGHPINKNRTIARSRHEYTLKDGTAKTLQHLDGRDLLKPQITGGSKHNLDPVTRSYMKEQNNAKSLMEYSQTSDLIYFGSSS